MWTTITATLLGVADSSDVAQKKTAQLHYVLLCTEISLEKPS